MANYGEISFKFFIDFNKMRNIFTLIVNFQL